MNFIFRFFLFSLFLCFSNLVISQSCTINCFKKKDLNWYNKSYKKDKILGTGVDRAYDILLNDRRPKKTVVIAVLDSGVDINHEDLKDKIWVNEDEIPDNGIDDDNNGYIDDIHGWNFLGNAKGENVRYENLEETRIIKKDSTSEYFAAALKSYNAQLKIVSKQKDILKRISQSFFKAKNIIKNVAGVDVKFISDLEKIESNNPSVHEAKKHLYRNMKRGFDPVKFEKSLDSNREFYEYHLNKEFNPRKIVGDDPENILDTIYGNNDVIGPECYHGTSVAGVIAAIRGNKIGIDGIADNVKIMVLRTTPKGDERDKDIALGIRYAVRNGADIINMSFGKRFSPYKEFVDREVKLAEEKDVLIVHAAGNEARDCDKYFYYPTSKIDGRRVSNWLNVGAINKKRGKKMVGIFSNYGKKNVELFAPGVDIVSLDNDNGYRKCKGTSLSAPVVSGVAALILAYYPELKPSEIIKLLLDSSEKFKKSPKVYIPNFKSKKRKTIRFNELSVSGGIVDAYKALQRAEELSRN